MIASSESERVSKPPVGIEPTTVRLRSACSANWAIEAGDVMDIESTLSYAGVHIIMINIDTFAFTSIIIVMIIINITTTTATTSTINIIIQQ